MYAPTLSSGGGGTVALDNADSKYHKSKFQINTVYKVNKADDDFDAKVHVETVDTVEPIINSNINKLKRGWETLASQPDSPQKPKKTKKSANNTFKATITSNESVDEKRRVGCPFFKQNGTLKQPSCNGKGWPDPGKMKDHLKSVHKIEHKWLNENIHFKEKPYFGEPIDVQWKLAFQKLFPQIPKDNIPSAYIDDVNPPPRSAVPKKDTDALGKICLQKLLDQVCIEQFCDLPIPNLREIFEKVYNEAVQDWRQYAPITTLCSSRFNLPESSYPEIDHVQPALEATLPSLTVQTLTCMDRSTSPQIKTESPSTLSPEFDRYPTPKDDDAKPAIEAVAKANLIQPQEHVAKVDKPTCTSSTDQSYTFPTASSFSQPMVLPFGHEYPFSDTPHSKNAEFGLTNSNAPAGFDNLFMDFETSVNKNSAFLSGFNMPFMGTPFTGLSDPNEEVHVDGNLDLITDFCESYLWDENFESTCEGTDGLVDKT